MSYSYTDPASHSLYQGGDSFLNDFSDTKDRRNTRDTTTIPHGGCINLAEPPYLHRKQIAFLYSAEPPYLHRKQIAFLYSTAMTDRAKQGHPDHSCHPMTPSPSTPPSSKGSEPRSSRFIGSSSSSSTKLTPPGPFMFSPQDLDLPLDDDLWLPAEQASEMSMTSLEAGAIHHGSNGASVERGMLFPWMSDAEIV